MEVNGLRSLIPFGIMVVRSLWNLPVPSLALASLLLLHTRVRERSTKTKLAV